YLSLAHLPAAFVRERFPVLTQVCRDAGFDLAADRIPIAPAAHYLMGGVATALDGRTSVSGLFAAGDAACTGVHGANRLASNSLGEGLVFGARAGAAMLGWGSGGSVGAGQGAVGGSVGGGRGAVGGSGLDGLWDEGSVDEARGRAEMS